MRRGLVSALMASLMLLGFGAAGDRAARDGGRFRRPTGQADFSGSRGRRAPTRPLQAQPAQGQGRRRYGARWEPDGQGRTLGWPTALSALLDGAGVLDAVLGVRSRLGANGLSVFSWAGGGRPWEWEHFDRQLGALRQHFEPVGLDALVAHLDGRPLPRNAAIVTFDDPQRDALTEALPALERHGIQATFFVETDALSRRRLSWRDRIEILFSRSQVERAVLDYPVRLALDVAADRDQAQRLVVALIENVHQLDLDRLLEELGRALEVPWDGELERKLADERLLTWDDAREMQRRGMSFGSLTRRQRVLHTLNARELSDELTGSRDDLRRELGAAPLAVAYPGGLPIRRLPSVVRAVEAAGYRLGFTGGAGWDPMPRKLDGLDVRRVAVDGGVSPALFRGRLAVPPLFTGWST